jgi:hypothetical protein
MYVLKDNQAVLHPAGLTKLPNGAAANTEHHPLSCALFALFGSSKGLYTPGHLAD